MAFVNDPGEDAKKCNVCSAAYKPDVHRVVSDDGNFMAVAKVYTYYPTGKPTEPKRGWIINLMRSNEYGHWENADFYFNSIFLDCVIDLLTKIKELLGSLD